jgi:carbonic anhydrase
MKNIMDNNKRWVSEMNAEDPDFFTKLAKPQNPKYLYFGCSDSRVPANEILGLG